MAKMIEFNEGCLRSDKIKSISDIRIDGDVYFFSIVVDGGEKKMRVEYGTHKEAIKERKDLIFEIEEEENRVRYALDRIEDSLKNIASILETRG